MAGTIAPIISDIASFISKFAPLLSSVLTGQFAGIAISLLTSLFGIDTTKIEKLLEVIRNDPGAKIKIKALELQHEETLKKLQIRNDELEANDRKNARSRETSLRDHMPGFLAVSFFVYYALIQFYYGYYHISNNCSANDSLQKILIEIFKFYFGG